MHIIFWFKNLQGRDHLEYLGIDGKIIFVRLALKEIGW
jgi:hypothetical protein